MRVWDKNFTHPTFRSAEYAVYYPLVDAVKVGRERFDKVLGQGNPLAPAMLSTPEMGGVFCSASVLAEPHGDFFFRRARRNRRLVMGVLVFYGCVCLVFGLTYPDEWKASLTFLSVTGVMLLYGLMDSKLSFGTRSAFAERGKFYNWLAQKCRPYLITVALIYLATGIAQFGIGGNDFIEDYALDYAANGEYWRIVSGSLIHGSVAHWLTNFTMALVIASFAGPVLSTYFLTTFICGGIFAFGLDWTVYEFFKLQTADGLVGTSGGMAALAGAQVVLSLRFRASYPRYFYVTMLYFAVVTFVAASLFIAKSSLTCHVFGLLAGAMIGLLVPDYLSINENATPEGGV